MAAPMVPAGAPPIPVSTLAPAKECAELFGVTL